MNAAIAETETQSAARSSSLATERQSFVLISLALAVLVVALYLPALHNGFINYDDPDYVTHNAHVLRGLAWENVKWAFRTDNPAANWHPLTWISHMTDVQVFGLKPWGHHLINVLLMAVDVVLLFWSLVMATGKLWRSAAVAAIFAVHPLNVESVAWVAERKQELFFLFMFLTLIAYVSYVRRPNIARYLVMTLLFALGLMSKVMIITLPFALLLLDYWPLGRFPELQNKSASAWRALASLVIEKVPLFVLSAAAAWITLGIHRRQKALTTMMPLSWRLKNVVYSYAVYLWKAIWPTRLAVFYPHAENRLPVWQVIAAAVVLVGISALVWKYRWKKYLPVGWLWYLGTAFPMIGLIQSGRQGMADRYEVLPILGVLVAVVWLLADVRSEHKLTGTVPAMGFAAILLSLASLTYAQIGYWKDSETLFAHALEVTTHNGIAENNLGAAYMEKGEALEAFPHFQAAVAYAPDMGSAHYNLGVLLQRLNRLPEAAEQYRLAVAYAADPEAAAHAHNNLGVIYLNLNNLTVAKAEFDKAISLNPNEMNSYLARGTAEVQLGEFDSAIADFTQVASRAPSPIALYWLGRAEEAKGDFPRAKAAYEGALRMAPGMQEARTRLESLKTLAGQ